MYCLNCYVFIPGQLVDCTQREAAARDQLARQSARMERQKNETRLLQQSLQRSVERERVFAQQIITTSPPSESSLTAVLEQQQQLAEDLAAELADSKDRMEDLIVEIDAIASEEQAAQKQCLKLAAQNAEIRDMEQAIIGENTKLHLEKVQFKKLQSEFDSR